MEVGSVKEEEERRSRLDRGRSCTLLRTCYQISAYEYSIGWLAMMVRWRETVMGTVMDAEMGVSYWILGF